MYCTLDSKTGTTRPEKQTKFGGNQGNLRVDGIAAGARTPYRKLATRPLPNKTIARQIDREADLTALEKLM